MGLLCLDEQALLTLRHGPSSHIYERVLSQRAGGTPAATSAASGGVFERLLVHLQGDCGSALMTLSWSCLAQPALVREDRQRHDLASSPFQSWALSDKLLGTIAAGEVPGSLLPRKTLSASLVAAGAPPVLIAMFAREPWQDDDDDICARTCAVLALVAVLLREACGGGDACLRQCGRMLMPALARALLLPGDSALHLQRAAGSPHTTASTASSNPVRAWRKGVAALVGTLSCYRARGCGGLLPWLLGEQGIRLPLLTPLLSSCVSFAASRETPPRASGMVLCFLHTLALSDKGAQTLTDSVSHAGVDMLRALLQRGRDGQLPDHVKLLEELLDGCGLPHAQASAPGKARPGRATPQELALDAEAARRILKAPGRRVNLTEMAGGAEDETLLRAGRLLAEAGLGSLVRYLEGAVLQLDFQGLSPIAFTREKKSILRAALAQLLSDDLHLQRSTLPAFASLYEHDEHISKLMQVRECVQESVFK